MKRIWGVCGAVLAALFFCPNAQASNADITRDQYLIYASTTSGITEVGVIPSTAPGADTADNVLFISTFNVGGSIAYFKTDQTNFLSAQAVASSVTYTAQTFNDGQQATATLTVNSYTGLSTAAASGQFTGVSTSAAVGVVGSASVVISSNVSGTQVSITGPPGALNFMVGGNVAQGFSSTNTAVNFAAAVNATTTNSNVTASVNASSTVVTVTCVNAGTFCNSYAVTSTSPTAISTAAFSGGTNPVSVSIAGFGVFTAGNQFQVGSSTAAMMNNLAAAFNVAYGTTTGAGIVYSTAPLDCTIHPCGILFSTAVVAGTFANGYSLTTSNSLAISTSANFMGGGQNNAVLCVNGTCLTANKDYYPQTSVTQTATNIVTAWNLLTASQTVTLVSQAGVISATATVVGTAANSYLITVTTNAITPTVLVSSSGITGAQVGTLSGGQASATTINSPIITLPSGSNYDATGLAVYLSTGSNVALQPLVWGATYYIIDLATPNQFELAYTSTGALAGAAIVITSSQTKVTADTFTFNPLALTGLPAYQWMVSNDSVNWLPWVSTTYGQTISSATLSTYYSTGTVNNWDLGHVDYGWVGLQVTPPVTGAISLKVKTIGKGD